MTLIDSNVLIDLLIDDPKWSDWSLAHLEQAALKGPLLINDIVYAETSTRYLAIEDLESALGIANVSVVPTPRTALFSRRQSLHSISPRWWNSHRRAGGLFYRRPCGSRRTTAVDARLATLSSLFSDSGIDHAAKREIASA